MNQSEQIEDFLAGSRYAVVGASRDREKYGNKAVRAYRQKGREVYPVNPNADEIEDLQAYPDLASLPEEVWGISIVTPPEVTEKVLAQASELGISRAWLQPGSEHPAAIERARAAGMSVIADGPCVLVALGYRE